MFVPLASCNEGENPARSGVIRHSDHFVAIATTTTSFLSASFCSLLLEVKVEDVDASSLEDARFNIIVRWYPSGFPSPRLSLLSLTVGFVLCYPVIVWSFVEKLGCAEWTSLQLSVECKSRFPSLLFREVEFNQEEID
jgi:hypothetical protein